MIGRIIEVQTPGISLLLDRGFMSICNKEGEISRVPICDMSTLVLSGPGIMVSTNLMTSLQNNGAIIVFTGNNYHPNNILWPIDTHHKHHYRIYTQINTSVPIKKKLWSKIVIGKIINQSSILKHYNGDDCGLLALSCRVRSGDPENIESQAARKYWKALLGNEFIRDPNIKDSNSFLNYGYSVVRGAMARAISACGMHPAIGIHHDNQSNPFCLVDDLMEVFRPIVDLFVRNLKDSGFLEISPEVKKYLSNILSHDLKTLSGEISTVSNCILRLSQTFYNSLENGKVLIELPSCIIPTSNYKL